SLFLRLRPVFLCVRVRLCHVAIVFDAISATPRKGLTFYPTGIRLSRRCGQRTPAAGGATPRRRRTNGGAHAAARLWARFGVAQPLHSGGPCAPSRSPPTSPAASSAATASSAASAAAPRRRSTSAATSG